jgi:hypothetical protein
MHGPALSGNRVGNDIDQSCFASDNIANQFIICEYYTVFVHYFIPPKIYG